MMQVVSMKFCCALSLLVICAISCSQEPKAPSVNFEIRGLHVEARNSEYSTEFTHKATILALGESVVSKRPYLVTLRVTRISGGDPETSSNYPLEFAEVVRGGVGDFALFGGSRSKKTEYSEGETWQPEKIKVEVTGYVPAFPVEGVTAESQ